MALGQIFPGRNGRQSFGGIGLILLVENMKTSGQTMGMLVKGNV